jgi:DNA ligase-1
MFVRVALMRDSDEILGCIESVAATASKNEKLAMVRAYMDDELFKRVCEYAYNPFKTFGIVKIPNYTEDCEPNEFSEQTWIILDALIDRSLTGDAARLAVGNELGRLTKDSAELMKRILRKDLRAGFGESTCNKAVKGLIPDFPYMRCALPKDTDLSKWPWQHGVFVQEKADGMFANVDHEVGGVVRITSRQGSAFPIEKFENMANDIRSRLTAGAQCHGEIVVLREGVVCERQDGNGVLNSILGGGDFEPNEMPLYLVWDQIPLSAVVTKGRHDTPYRTRIAGITSQLASSPGESVKQIATYKVSSLKEAMLYYRKLLAKGKEGVVIKHPDAIWKDTTSKEQIKLKLEVDVDLKITAIVPGKDGGKNEGKPGSLTCVTSDGLLQVDVTVKNDAIRQRIIDSPDDWIDRILVVRSNSVMLPSESNGLHSLFLPRMVEHDYRTDKTEPDSLIRVLDQFEAAIK